MWSIFLQKPFNVVIFVSSDVQFLQCSTFTADFILHRMIHVIYWKQCLLYVYFFRHQNIHASEVILFPVITSGFFVLRNVIIYLMCCYDVPFIFHLYFPWLFLHSILQYWCFICLPFFRFDYVFTLCPWFYHINSDFEFIVSRDI